MSFCETVREAKNFNSGSIFHEIGQRLCTECKIIMYLAPTFPPLETNQRLAHQCEWNCGKQPAGKEESQQLAGASYS